MKFRARGAEDLAAAAEHVAAQYEALADGLTAALPMLGAIEEAEALAVEARRRER